MNERQARAIQLFERVRKFLSRHPRPVVRTYGRPEERLEEVMVQIRKHARNQRTAIRMGRAYTKQKRAMQCVLVRRYTTPIMMIGGVVCPGAFQKSRETRRASTLQFIAEAEALHKFVSHAGEKFADATLPADFLPQFGRRIEELRQCVVSRGSNTGRQAGATAALRHEISSARAAVQLLGALVTATFAEDDRVMAEWAGVLRPRKAARKLHTSL